MNTVNPQRPSTCKQVTRFTGSKHVASNNTLAIPFGDRLFRTYCRALFSLSSSPVFYARKYLLRRSSAGLLSAAVSFKIQKMSQEGPSRRIKAGNLSRHKSRWRVKEKVPCSNIAHANQIQKQVVPTIRFLIYLSEF